LIVERLPDEGAVVERILAGDREAFAEVVSRYHRVVFSVAYRMTGTRAEAEDLCQEVFLRFYRSLHRFDRRMPLGPWLRKIACNQSLNHLRRRSLERRLLQEPDPERALAENVHDASDGPEERLAQSERADRLQRALSVLSPHQRAAVTLKYVEGLTAEEIAKAMDAPTNTVKTWLLRAREKLRRELADEL
jgi:RNA polymerase sigma-70 factor (ECF subfamily)